jgi:pyruvate,water dikinase
MRVEALENALDESSFGGKAAGLARTLQAGLQVPPGLALDVEMVEAMLTSKAAMDLCESIVERLRGRPLAVRSSAVGEDSEEASFAGQHLTCLNVRGAEALIKAIREVRASAGTASALAYRRKLGLDEAPRLGIVVQRMVAAETAGVLFTTNPVTGADERVIEASWGLGEAVVAGIVTPDRWRMLRDGTVVEALAGEKDVEIVPLDNGVEERPVEGERVYELCLGTHDLAKLAALAQRCDEHFGAPSDVEWAFEDDELYLLQRRAVTTTA